MKPNPKEDQPKSASSHSLSTHSSDVVLEQRDILEATDDELNPPRADSWEDEFDPDYIPPPKPGADASLPQFASATGVSKTEFKTAILHAYTKQSTQFDMAKFELELSNCFAKTAKIREAADRLSDATAEEFPGEELLHNLATKAEQQFATIYDGARAYGQVEAVLAVGEGMVTQFWAWLETYAEEKQDDSALEAVADLFKDAAEEAREKAVDDFEQARNVEWEAGMAEDFSELVAAATGSTTCLWRKLAADTGSATEPAPGTPTSISSKPGSSTAPTIEDMPVRSRAPSITS